MSSVSTSTPYLFDPSIFPENADFYKELNNKYSCFVAQVFESQDKRIHINRYVNSHYVRLSLECYNYLYKLQSSKYEKIINNFILKSYKSEEDLRQSLETFLNEFEGNNISTTFQRCRESVALVNPPGFKTLKLIRERSQPWKIRFISKPPVDLFLSNSLKSANFTEASDAYKFILDVLEHTASKQ